MIINAESKIIKLKCSQVYENIKKENMDGEKKTKH